MVGNRQLLTIGGTDPAEQERIALVAENATDTFSQGLGIFDITDMVWSNHYNASAAPYESPKIVAEHYRTNNRYPHWDSQDLKDLIINGTLSNIPSSTNTASGAPSQTSPGKNSTVSTKSKGMDLRNGGTIAGVATGSFAALVFIGVLAYLFIRRRQRKPIRKRKMREIELDSMRIEELPDKSRTELPVRSYHELSARSYCELHADTIPPAKYGNQPY
jgi:hypothetical protein